MDERLIDLDAARAARAEERGEAPVLKLGGKEFALPVELPLEFGRLWSTGQTFEGLQLLIGLDRWDEFRECHMSNLDLEQFIIELAKVYQVPNGKASSGSSKSSGKRSRRISSGSTG